MRNQTVLITGGAGFIGSALCESLLLIGYEIICLDNFDDYYSPKIKENNIQALLENDYFNLERGDIRDVDFLNTIFSKYKINAVVHLAGKGGVRNSINNILEYFDVNVTGSINVLEAMKKFNVSNFIFASSSSVYGENNEKLKETDCSNHQLSPYASTKKTVELLTYNYYKNHNFNILNLRLFSVYGNKQRPDLFIHKVFEAIYKNKEVEIYGNGQQTRDFTHINDVLVAIQNSLQVLNSNSNIYEVINIGNQKPISVNELIKVIEKELKISVQAKYISKQIGDVQATFADISKAKEILKYSPSINIYEGIKKYNKWFKKMKNERNT